MVAAVKKLVSFVHLTDPHRYATLIAAVPIGVLAALFWGQRAIDPLTAPALLLDRSLQLLTLGLVVAALLVLARDARIAIGAVCYLGAVGFLLGASVALTGLIRGPADVRAVALGVLCAAIGATLAIRFGLRLPGTRSVATRGAIALVAAAVPLLQFWNGAAFLPGRTEATLTQRMTIKVAARVAHQTRVNLDYTATNPTDARVLVIISRLTVCWWTADEQPVYDNAEVMNRPNCRWYRPIGDHSWLSPKTPLIGSHAFAIPAGHPHVTAIARIAYARGDRLRLDEASGAPRPAVEGNCFSTTPIHLEEESRVKSLAQRPKYLVYYRRFQDGGTGYYFARGSTSRCPQRVSGGPSRLAEYFGVTDGREVLDFWMTR